jgi:hypothetical protein
VNVSVHSLEALDEADREAALRDILDAVERLRASDPDQRRLKVVSLRLWNRTAASGEDPLVADPLIAALESRFCLPAGSLDGKLAGTRGATLRPGISVHPAERFSWPDPAAAAEIAAGAAPCRGFRSGSIRGFCRALRDQAGILVDGTVVPCCLDGEGIIALGNIYRESWADIIGSPRARALYDGFSRREVLEPLCRTCGYRTRF